MRTVFERNDGALSTRVNAANPTNDSRTRRRFSSPTQLQFLLSTRNLVSSRPRLTGLNGERDGRVPPNIVALPSDFDQDGPVFSKRPPVVGEWVTSTEFVLEASKHFWQSMYRYWKHRWPSTYREYKENIEKTSISHRSLLPWPVAATVRPRAQLKQTSCDDFSRLISLLQLFSRFPLEWNFHQPHPSLSPNLDHHIYMIQCATVGKTRSHISSFIKCNTETFNSAVRLRDALSLPISEYGIRVPKNVHRVARGPCSRMNTLTFSFRHRRLDDDPHLFSTSDETLFVFSFLGPSYFPGDRNPFPYPSYLLYIRREQSNFT